MINIVVLAGSSSEGELEKYAEASNKAAIPIKGIPMLVYVLKALHGISRVKEIKILGSAHQLQPALSGKWSRLEIVPEKKSLVENLEAGLQSVEQETPCLIVTSDIPLITSEAVEDFISRCYPFNKEFYYPVIEETECKRKFPQVERTCVSIKEGRFTGGNLALVNPASILSQIDRLHTIFSYRKKPWKYARMLSPLLVFKLMFKIVSISELENHISRIMSLEVSAVRTPYVEIGTDVDKPADLELVRKYL